MGAPAKISASSLLLSSAAKSNGSTGLLTHCEIGSGICCVVGVTCPGVLVTGNGSIDVIGLPGCRPPKAMLLPVIRLLSGLKSSSGAKPIRGKRSNLPLVPVKGSFPLIPCSILVSVITPSGVISTRGLSILALDHQPMSFAVSGETYTVIADGSFQPTSAVL